MPRHVIVLGVPDKLAVRLQENVLPLAGMSLFYRGIHRSPEARQPSLWLPVGQHHSPCNLCEVCGPSGWTLE